MALKDQELLNTPLIDLTQEEKRKLKSILISKIEKLRNSKKRPGLLTTPSGIGPGFTFNQEEIDGLQRKINEINKSLKTGEQKNQVLFPTSDTYDRAKGGAQYSLSDGKTGLVQYTDPKNPDYQPVGYLIYQPKTRTGLDVKEGVRFDLPNVVTQDDWSQSVYNKYSTDPQATMNLKKKLVELGVLPSITVIDGVPDNTFITAMDTVAAGISTENYRRLQSDKNQKLFTLDEGLNDDNMPF